MNIRHFNKYLLVLMLTHVLWGAHVVLADPLGQCDQLLATVSQDLADAYQTIQKISPALIQAEQTPKWGDFDALKRVISAVRNGKQLAAETGKLKELEHALSEIEKSVPDNPLFLLFRESGKAERTLKVEQYRPGEYELKREYQHLLWELNRELPASLKIPGVRIPYDLRKTAVIESGRAIIARHEKTFQDFFYDTGFANIDEVKKALTEYDDTTRKLLVDFEAENVELAMNRPLSARWWVPRVGFQNQRVTGTSRGTLSPEMRNTAEAKLIGEDLATYQATDDQLKPVYGYLRPRPNAGFKQSVAAQQYGEDTYIFKKERVNDRLTWTSGDSLGYGRWGANSPQGKPQNWKGYFVPWKYRYLLIPDLLFLIENQEMGFQAQIGGMSKRLFPDLPAAPIQPPYPAMISNYKTPPQPNLPPAPVTANFVPRAIPEGPPSAPAHMALPLQPLLGPLKEGQTFNEAVAVYHETEGYRKFLSESNDVREKNRISDQEFNNSEALKEYRLKKAVFDTSERDRLVAFQQSEQYRAYQAEYQKWNAEVNAIQAKFRESAVYLDYAQELKIQQAEAQADYQRKMAEYQVSEIYKKFLAEHAAYQQALNVIQQTELFKWQQFNTRISPYSIYAGSELGKMRGAQTQGYVELQYWGPVTLDDVEIFQFKTEPPSGEFLEELKKRNITIRDGRVEPAVEWKSE